MTKKKKYSVEDADGYRLRMIYGEWYILLYKVDEQLGAIGPWDYRQAVVEASEIEKTTRDLDKGKTNG